MCCYFSCHITTRNTVQPGTNEGALTSASLASRASSCSWKSLLSISSLARSASSLICFSRARIWRSIWVEGKKPSLSLKKKKTNQPQKKKKNHDHSILLICCSSGAGAALTFLRAFSSLAWAFICCTSMESTFLLLMKRSWLPMHSCKIWRHRWSRSEVIHHSYNVI